MVQQIKNFLKKYKFAWYVHDKIRYYQHMHKRNKAYKYMSALNNRRKVGKTKVGFLVQEYAAWDKQKDIYEEMLKRENIEPVIIVVPLSNWQDCSVQMFYDEDNYFLKHYPQAVKAFDNEKFIDLRTLALDYLFYPRPYDVHLPVEYRSDNMVKYVKCCYIPYGYNSSEVLNDLGVENSFLDNMKMMFVDSDFTYTKYMQRSVPLNLNIQKVFNIGYPAMEAIIKTLSDEISGIKTIAWTPRWSYDFVVGGSHFLEYKDKFINLVEQHRDKTFIFRPHPLMFREMLRKNFMTQSEIDNFTAKLQELGVILDFDSLINDVLVKTDLLISDFSSILMQFFVTGKPIIYCKCNIPLNDDFTEIVSNNYEANSWDDVLECLNQILSDNDVKRGSRIQFVKRKYARHIGASERIVDKIEDDYNVVNKK